MNLGELIERLEKADPDQRVMEGFGDPHSWRGSYDELSFAPERNVTAGEMLAHAKSALGRTFMGYKGGNYMMSEYTTVHVQEYGNCDLNGEDVLTKRWLEQMLAVHPTEERA